MRVAVCGGTYSNPWALRAFIDDARSKGAERLYCLGDLGGYGAEPEAIRELLAGNGVICLCRPPGYADRAGVFTGQGSVPGSVVGIIWWAAERCPCLVRISDQTGVRTVEKYEDARGAAGTGDDSEVLLAEFRSWLGRERGLAAESARCYANQAKAFLAGAGGPGALGGLDAGQVTAFTAGFAQDRNSWTAKAMVTSLRAFLRFAHATGRTSAPLAGAVPAVASWRASALPKGLTAAEVSALLAGCDRGTRTGLRDHAILTLLASLGLRGAEAAGLQLADIDWRAGEVTVTGKGSRTERLPLPAPAGEALAAWLKDGRPACGSRAVFTTVRRPYRQVTPAAVRAVMKYACQRAGIAHHGAHELRHSLATGMLRAGASLPEVGQVLRHKSMLSTAVYANSRELHQAGELCPVSRLSLAS